MLFSSVRLFLSFSLTRPLTPSRHPSLPHLYEPNRLYFRISSSLPASLNISSILNFYLLSLPPFSDFVFSFSYFVHSSLSFTFSLIISNSISLKFLSHASAQSHQQSSLLENSRSLSFVSLSLFFISKFHLPRIPVFYISRFSLLISPF